MIETLFYTFTGVPESKYIFTKTVKEPWMRGVPGIWELPDGLLLCECNRARVVQSDPINTRLRGEIKRLPVGFTPSHIVRVFRAVKRSEVFAVRRKNP